MINVSTLLQSLAFSESNVCLQVFLCVLDKTLCQQKQEESLEEALECVNENIDNLSLLTDFPIGAYICYLIMVYFHAYFIKFIPETLRPYVLENRWIFLIVFVCRVSLSG